MKEVGELGDCELAELGRRLIIGIPDAVVFADREVTIRFWSAAFARSS